MTCVFCDIVAGNKSAVVVNRSENTITFRPLDPVVPGHLLVAPTTHAEWLDDLDALDAANVIVKVQEIGRSLRSAYNVIQSNGEAATQTIPHVHFHLVPREHGDGLSLPWTKTVDAGAAP